MLSWFKLKRWKEKCLAAEAEVESAKRALKALFEDVREINNIIRRNADCGNLDKLLVSPNEIKSLHDARKKLAAYYQLPLEHFENSAWLLRRIIEGTDE